MSFPGLKNHGPVSIPGTDVVAYLGHWVEGPKADSWVYALYTTGTGEENLIAQDDLYIPQPDTYTVTPEQIARIAFLLEVEYAS